VQKPTLKSYFSRDAFIETLIFPQAVTWDKLEVIMKCLCFIDNNTVDTYRGAKKIYNKKEKAKFTLY
jgi:hypothetical protein